MGYGNVSSWRTSTGVGVEATREAPRARRAASVNECIVFFFVFGLGSLVVGVERKDAMSLFWKQIEGVGAPETPFPFP